MAHKILTSPTSGADNTQLYGVDWNKLINNLTGASSSDPFTLNVDHHTFKHSTTNVAGDLLKGDGTRYSRWVKGSPLQVPRVNTAGSDLEWHDLPLPMPYSFFVYKDGSNYKARNGLTGSVDYTNTDAAVVIRSAFAALPSDNATYAGPPGVGGGVVYLAPNTTFDLNSRVITEGTVPEEPYINYFCVQLKGNQSLIGGGMGSTILKVGNGIQANAVEAEIHLEGSGVYLPNIRIEDMTIDGNLGGNTADTVHNDGNQCGIRMHTCAQYVVRNVEIRYCWQQGVYWTSCQSGLFDRLYSHHNNKEGYANDAADWTTMIECDAFSNGAAGMFLVGGTGRNPSNCTIIGGTYYNNQLNSTSPVPNTQHGMFIRDARWLSLYGVRVYRSGNAALRGDNIHISNCDNVWVTDCISAEAYRAGLMINNSENITVRGGSYYNNRYDAVDSAGSGIYLINALYCVFDGVRAFDNRATKVQPYGLHATGTSDYNVVSNCDFRGNALNHMLTVGIHTRRHNNMEYITDNVGSGTVPSGSTNVTVNHGLSEIGHANRTILTPINNLGNATKYWADNWTATTFRINVNADPGASTAAFVWRISAP